MNLHTQGTWTADFDDFDAERGSIAISTREWGAFARVVVTMEGEPSQEGRANAYLIASSPKMLAALEAAYEALPNGDVKIQVAKAIATARGVGR
jgi:hypothetical protein